jgi:hypothetical protein
MPSKNSSHNLRAPVFGEKIEKKVQKLLQ